MGKKIKKYKNIIERYLSGDEGQRMFNFAYSIGAAIVIWGALFKILHLPGGNTLLSIGMGTEVLMFILTAFDRPGREYKWEEVFPVLDSKNPEDRPDFNSGSGIVINGVDNATGGQVSLVAGGTAVANPIAESSPEATEQYMDQMTQMAQQMQKLRETTEALNNVSQVLLDSYKAITENSESINQSSTGYVEQMQNLNRNISGLNTIYEIQLKSVSSQLDAIERVNRGIKDICSMYEVSSAKSARYCEESEKMAQYMQQLNQVYERMLHAMTINMYQQPIPQAPVNPVPPVNPTDQANV